VVLRFAKYAQKRGVAVVFNTGRREDALAKPSAWLRAAGYPVAGMCGRRAGEAVAVSKQRCRQQYVDAGYTIIANVGNRSTDFVGGNYERAFKLPNYNNRLG
jgi:predicted secreted acid phosphatase